MADNERDRYTCKYTLGFCISGMNTPLKVLHSNIRLKKNLNENIRQHLGHLFSDVYVIINRSNQKNQYQQIITAENKAAPTLFICLRNGIQLTF